MSKRRFTGNDPKPPWQSVALIPSEAPLWQVWVKPFENGSGRWNVKLVLMQGKARKANYWLIWAQGRIQEAGRDSWSLRRCYPALYDAVQTALHEAALDLV